jgi:hypothetical protein
MAIAGELLFLIRFAEAYRVPSYNLQLTDISKKKNVKEKKTKRRLEMP